MSNVTASLVVDLGNSQTRVITQIAKNGEIDNRFSVLPNRYAFVENDYEIPEQYLVDEDNPTYVFHQKDFVHVAGLYSDVEMSGSQMRPTSEEKKYNSSTTDQSLNMAFYAAYQDLSILLGERVEDLEVTWKVTLLNPPADVDYGKDLIAKKVRSIEEIIFDHPTKLRKKIVIDDVTVLPEGFCAFMGTVFTRKGVLRREFAPLVKESCMIIDVGAGTTDYALIKNGQLVDSMKDSISIGGNHVIRGFSKELRQQGYSVSYAQEEEANATGKIQDGHSEKDISDSIIRSRENIARKLVRSLQDYLELSDYPPRSIQNLLVVGGGTLNTIENAEPLAEMIVRYFKELSPNVRLVELPLHKVFVEDEYGDFHAQMVPVSPRHLNIIGAAVLAAKKILSA